MEKIVGISNVYYSYNAGTEDEVEALSGVSFDIYENDFIALCGHNGSGKSTVAKLLNGLYQPQSGDVVVFGINTCQSKQLFDIRKQCGVVFQNPDNQMVASIIEDDIAFGPENLGIESQEISQRVDWALECVGMSEHRHGTPFRLSGGQKQRIAIAGVLAMKPKILVLDESTSMLDPIGRQEVLRVVKRLHEEEKITVVMITHFMEEAALADRIIVMNKGKIAMDGGKEILKNQNELEQLGLQAPLAVRLSNCLRNAGLNIDSAVTNEELVDRLCELAQKEVQEYGN